MLTHPRAHAPQREKPLQLEGSPRMLQSEESLQSNKDPAQPKIHTFKKHLWCYENHQQSLHSITQIQQEGF